MAHWLETRRTYRKSDKEKAVLLRSALSCEGIPYHVGMVCRSSSMLVLRRGKQHWSGFTIAELSDIQRRSAYVSKELSMHRKCSLCIDIEDPKCKWDISCLVLLRSKGCYNQVEHRWRQWLMAIRLRVKEIAKQKGFSMGKLQRDADVAYNTVKRMYKNPYHVITTETLGKLARALGVPPGELIEEVPDTAV